MITLNTKTGRGYFRGDEVEKCGLDRINNLVRLIFKEGHRKGEIIDQPIEFVRYI